MAIGVVSAVELLSLSLVTGESCKGGGVSRESSFTTVQSTEQIGGDWLAEACGAGKDTAEQTLRRDEVDQRIKWRAVRQPRMER